MQFHVILETVYEVAGEEKVAGKRALIPRPGRFVTLLGVAPIDSMLARGDKAFLVRLLMEISTLSQSTMGNVP